MINESIDDEISVFKLDGQTYNLHLDDVSVDQNGDEKISFSRTFIHEFKDRNVTIH